MVHIPLRLRIDGDALVSNWRWLAAKSGSASCGAAVKANGYGLGAREAVERLAGAGCRDFFVATWAEAAALGPWPEGLNLSVLHGIGPDDLAAVGSLPGRPVLNSAAQVARWREQGGGPCDVMVDTGMNRLGLSLEEVRSGVLDGLTIETLLSHLACADEPGHPLNEVQLSRFRALCEHVAARRYSLANSAGICLGEDWAFDLTRPGLALYGGVPVVGDTDQEQGLRQVAFVEAQLLQLRQVKPGESVGYGATFVADEPLTAGILNIGYADGYLRSIAPGGRIRAGGAPRPVIGRISMDLIAVDLTGADVVEGNWVEVDYHLPTLSAASGLSQYELLTALGTRYDRIWR